ncbi:MAG: hypothetical protein UY79_C0002G0028 [Parcubacteria group bacterium GW2011_GWA2_53_21]|nr:MAG: hypothetical protein UY79_C0002G0028 [Parcubacteria group bacterium GW2011_GWA2_53_21]
MASAKSAFQAPDSRPPQGQGSERRLRLVHPEGTEAQERAASETQLQTKIRTIKKELQDLWDRGFIEEADALEDELEELARSKEQLGESDYEAFRDQVTELSESLGVLKNAVNVILERDNLREKATATPTGKDSSADSRPADTAIIDLNRVRGEPRRKDFEPGRKATVDIPAALVKDIVRESGERNNLIRAVVSSDQQTARDICHDLLDRRGSASVQVEQTDLEAKLDKVLAPQGFTLEQFREQWKDGLYELVLKVVQDRADAEIRKQAVAEISTIDKLKLNWKGIAKKALLIGGITAATATGFGAVFGAAAAIGAGVATGGVISRFFQGFAKKRREEGAESADEKEAQSRMNALIQKKKSEIVDKLVKEWESDETGMSLVLSQAIREASAGDENANRTIVQDSLLKTAERLKADGEADEAQARELEGLIAGLGNLRETDPELKKLIADAESTPVAIEILKKLQEAKSGQLFAAAKGDTKKSKIEKAAGYLAPIAVGAAVGLAYTSGVAVGARAGLGAFGMGVTGYKMGEARDRAAKEKQVEVEVNEVMKNTETAVGKYKDRMPPVELTEHDLGYLRDYVGKLDADIEILSALQTGKQKTLLLTEAEAIVHEARRIIREIEKTSELLVALRKQRETIVEHAGAQMQRINKDAGRWRRWVGLAAGAVVGGGIGFLGGEWAEQRQEVKMEEKLDELLAGVPAGVKDRALQSFAAPGHEVHDVEDLTFAELKGISVDGGKALDVGLIQLKITEAQGRENLLRHYGLQSHELDVMPLHDRVEALQDMSKTFAGWEEQGLEKDAIAAIGAMRRGVARGPAAETVNNLLAWDKAHGGHTAVVKMLNRDIPLPQADVTKVLESAVRLKDSITGWEKSGLNAGSIDAIARVDTRTMEAVDQLLERGGENKGIIARFINANLGEEGADLHNVLREADMVGRKISTWTKHGLSAEAIDAIDVSSSAGVAGKAATIDRLVAGAGGNADAMHTLNAQLEGGTDIDTALKSVLVARERGANSVTALVARQLSANPGHYGFDAQKRFTDAAEWAKHEAARLAIEGGYINKDGHSHLGVVWQNKKDNFVLLTEDENGHLGIKVTGKTYIMDAPPAATGSHRGALSAAESARVNIRGMSGNLTKGDSAIGSAADVAQAGSSVRTEGVVVNTGVRVTKLTAALHREFLGDKYYQAGTKVHYPGTPAGMDEKVFRQQFDEQLSSLKALSARYESGGDAGLAERIKTEMTKIAKRCTLSPEELYSAKMVNTFLNNPSAIARR